jgi:hypothetical protein
LEKKRTEHIRQGLIFNARQSHNTQVRGELPLVSHTKSDSKKIVKPKNRQPNSTMKHVNNLKPKNRQPNSTMKHVNTENHNHARARFANRQHRDSTIKNRDSSQNSNLTTARAFARTRQH